MRNRSVFYITAGNMEEAEKLARVLVEKKLAACVNVLPGIKSFFYWEGEVQSEEEVLLLGKTSSELVEELTEEVQQQHSYEVPCTLTWDISGGNKQFLDWIGEETK